MAAVNGFSCRSYAKGGIKQKEVLERFQSKILKEGFELRYPQSILST